MPRSRWQHEQAARPSSPSTFTTHGCTSSRSPARPTPTTPRRSLTASQLSGRCVLLMSATPMRPQAARESWSRRSLRSAVGHASCPASWPTRVHASDWLPPPSCRTGRSGALSWVMQACQECPHVDRGRGVWGLPHRQAHHLRRLRRPQSGDGRVGVRSDCHGDRPDAARLSRGQPAARFPVRPATAARRHCTVRVLASARGGRCCRIRLCRGQRRWGDRRITGPRIPGGCAR
jgi:hypothetical protein